MAEPLRARRLGDTDADAIADFMRAVGWEANATPERVRDWLRSAAADNPFEPGTAPPLVGVFVGTLLAGCLGSIPTRFWNGNELVVAHWLKGFWVRDEYRDGLIGYLLLKEMLKNVRVAASMPAGLAARRLSVARGMVDLGALRNYIEPLRVARMLRRLDPRLLALNGVPRTAVALLRFARLPPVAYAAQAVIALCSRVLRLPGVMSARRLSTQLADRLPAESALDGLWARAQRGTACRASRSGAYLRWRYERGGSGRYLFASTWRGAELVALAVLQHPQRLDDPRLAGLGIGSVVDLLLDPGCAGALASVLGGARRWARSSGYDALLLTMSHGALRTPLLGAGYLPIPGNIHFMLRDSGERLSRSLDDWIVTRGDAWSDHL